jgi:glycosyltransferase involved in cell wall biosynthesis
MTEVYATIGAAAVLVMPSTWFEGLPKTLVESFAKGTPVIASRLGALAECVSHGRTGLHFQPGDASDLARQVRRVATNAPALTGMRAECRREYERRYTPEQNYRMLTEIYRAALERRRGGAPAPVAPGVVPAPRAV